MLNFSGNSFIERRQDGTDYQSYTEPHICLHNRTQRGQQQRTSTGKTNDCTSFNPLYAGIQEGVIEKAVYSISFCKCQFWQYLLNKV